MEFSEKEREIVYQAIFNRRDVRSEFQDRPVPDEVIRRILDAAHHAPSVGFMQPWDFIVVRDLEVRRQIKAAFQDANAVGATRFEGERREKYNSLKLEGILDAPMGICITCDRTRNGPSVLGKAQNPEMDLYSTVCAVQNLWLAARAENLGAGWVSIIDHDRLKQILQVPDQMTLVAYLCIGYVDFFHEKPQLEKAGWLSRIELDQLIHFDGW